MTITSQEVEALLADESKIIVDDIVWTKDRDHSPAVVFRSKVKSDRGYPLFIAGRMSPWTEKISFSLIYQGTGRVYGLDLGADHRNPDGKRLGEKHKHRWTDEHRDKWAYVPADITEPCGRTVEVWRQFCQEAKIVHAGEMSDPKIQGELLL